MCPVKGVGGRLGWLQSLVQRAALACSSAVCGRSYRPGAPRTHECHSPCCTYGSGYRRVGAIVDAVSVSQHCLLGVGIDGMMSGNGPTGSVQLVTHSQTRAQRRDSGPPGGRAARSVCPSAARGLIPSCGNAGIGAPAAIVELGTWLGHDRAGTPEIPTTEAHRPRLRGRRKSRQQNDTQRKRAD